MALRNGTYVRSSNSDRQLYWSRWFFIEENPLEENASSFELVTDQYEQVKLFMEMGEIIQPGESVEVIGKEV